MVFMVFPIVRERSIYFPPTCCATGETPPSLPRPSVPPISSTEAGTHFSRCSQLANAETWLPTVSSCTAEEAPWAPSVCSISSRKDGWAGVNVHANVLLRRMIAANLFMSSWNWQWVASIDMAANDEANENVIVKMSESFTEQAAQVSWQRFNTVS